MSLKRASEAENERGGRECAAFFYGSARHAKRRHTHALDRGAAPCRQHDAGFRAAVLVPLSSRLAMHPGWRAQCSRQRAIAALPT